MNHNLDFLFLSEADAVKAGAGDIHTCIQVMDEVFDLLGQGDYLMGAPNHNSVSYTHLRAHYTDTYLVCPNLLEK